MRTFFFALSFCSVAVGVSAADMPHFYEETKTAGIDHTYSGDFEYMAGAGLAVFDCNGDNLPDLYFAGGSDDAKLFQNNSRKGDELKFNVVENSGLNLKKVTGAYPLDIDGDGQTDLAVLRIGENVLMRGLGNCKFERANEAWNFSSEDAWTTAFSATWEKGNAWPTLVFGNFMDPETVLMGYGDCDSHDLYRPRAGNGYQKPSPLGPGHCSLSMLFSDWNRDGVPDLRITNDKEFYHRGEEQLYALPSGASPRLFSREEGWNKVNIWGMGIASHDITGDGYPDYYLTTMTENRFEVISGGVEKPVFEDRADERGIAAGFPFMGGDKKPSTAWHAEFGDVNNDGRADLLVVKGNVNHVQFVADADPNNLLIQQEDGRFIEGAKDSGVISYELGRSGALVDLNQDGTLDLVVTNRFAPVEIWRNQGGAGHWIQFKLDTPGVNNTGVGSWIEVKTKDRVQRREITVGGGHAGGQWGWIHFGLGNAKKAQVRVQHPGQKWTPWVAVSADRSVVLNQSSNGKIKIIGE